MFRGLDEREIEDEELYPAVDRRRDAELVLSFTTLAAIVIGLVVLCGGFFGLGYMVGHKGSAAPIVDAATAPANVANDAASSPSSALPKPSADPQSNLPQQAAPAAAVPVADSSATAPVSAPPVSSPVAVPPAVHTAPPPAPNPSQRTVASKAAPAMAASSEVMVQIASVSHQEDADVLVGALRKRGYTVSVHRDLGDNMLHVQLGPFTSRDDANTMRQKLLNDGYNAIVQP